MENKSLFVRRIIYIIVFILSLVFISFYGGNVPYMFFFAVVSNSILMLIYILYVFFTIKIYQSVTVRQMTKNEFVSYKLFLNNENIMAYRDIHLLFMDELSEVKGAKELGHISLEPGQGIERDMELICKYSGTFFVGVDSVEIMDYFKILKLRFPMPQKMKVTVKPRILYPSNLSFITKYEECHDASQNQISNDLIDNTVRKYQLGDNKNLIHWKNSVKKQELMIRTMIAEEIFKYVIIMDKSVEDDDSFTAIIQSDKLRELTIAMIHYVFELGFDVEVFLGNNSHREITSTKDFDTFFDILTEFEFGLEQNMSNLLYTLNHKYEKNVPFILITANSVQMEAKAIEDLNVYRNVHVIDVNSFDNIDEFLHVEERV